VGPSADLDVLKKISEQMRLMYILGGLERSSGICVMFWYGMLDGAFQIRDCESCVWYLT
jgi:hypothetical protein